MEGTPRKPYRKDYPKTLRELGDIENVQGRIRTRIVQYSNVMIGKSDPLLDIRVYVEDHGESQYTGWTKSGVTLRLIQVIALAEILNTVIEQRLLEAKDA